MPWFKVDDALAFHMKALSAGNPALGLWVRAGSWSMQQLSDGFVPASMVTALGGGHKDARALTQAGLWHQVEGGFQFHDWDEYQPTRAEVEAEREATRERVKKHRSKRGGNGDGNGVTNAVSNGVGTPAPSRPVPTPLEQLSNVSHLPKRESYPQDGPPNGVNLDAVRAAVQRHCGREASDMDCFRVIGTVMERAKSKPRDATRFVVAAVERDPFEFQKIIDEAVA